ncbi:MAG: hypothetical protein ACKVKF_18855, partial [Rhodobacterales bacterium]
MRADHHKRGGAPIGTLTGMDPWQAELILNLRLWCEGPNGQTQVWDSFTTALPDDAAQKEFHAFAQLIQLIGSRCRRPLIRHDLNCDCVGSDEGIFAHFVATASEGHLADAALMATLLMSAAEAESAAILAARVGTTARKRSGNT